MQDSSKKMSFFKKVWVSIKDFDKYELFIKEDLGQAIKYLLKMVAIFVIVLTIVTIHGLINTSKKVLNVIDKEVNDIHYQNGSITINNDEKKIILDFKDTIGEIVIDTSNLTEQDVQKYREELTGKESGVYILKDKIIIRNSNLSAIAESKYDDLIKNYNVKEFDKESLFKYYNKYYISFYIIMALVVYFYMFIIYVFNILIDCLAFTILAYITARIVRINLKWLASFNLAVHATTLPILLNIIYVIINALTGFTIKYFPIMYTGITYIYILTVILMIKSDYIKIIGEVQKIEEEQKKIREKLEQAREEEKRRQEKDDVKKKDKENEEKDNKEPRIGNSPEGDNA